MATRPDYAARIQRIQKAMADQQIDLLILDFEMPARGGLEITRWVRALEDERRSMPILLTSLAELPPSRLTEVTAFLPKPFSLAQILELLAEQLER